MPYRALRPTIIALVQSLFRYSYLARSRRSALSFRGRLLRVKMRLSTREMQNGVFMSELFIIKFPRVPSIIFELSPNKSLVNETKLIFACTYNETFFFFYKQLSLLYNYMWCIESQKNSQNFYIVARNGVSARLRFRQRQRPQFTTIGQPVDTCLISRAREAIDGAHKLSLVTRLMEEHARREIPIASLSQHRNANAAINQGLIICRIRA